MLTVTPLTFSSIAVEAGHLMSKTAFIHVNNGGLAGFIGLDLDLKIFSGLDVGLWMIKCFFYS